MPEKMPVASPIADFCFPPACLPKRNKGSELGGRISAYRLPTTSNAANARKIVIMLRYTIKGLFDGRLYSFFILILYILF
jgi:hypothetical protein